MSIQQRSINHINELIVLYIAKKTTELENERTNKKNNKIILTHASLRIESDEIKENDLLPNSHIRSLY